MKEKNKYAHIVSLLKTKTNEGKNTTWKTNVLDSYKKGVILKQDLK